jgi:predicted XRE-type DNA-binding protein
MPAPTLEVATTSANIFADLGLPDAQGHFLKAQIVGELYRLTKERKLTQTAAGRLMGISQPEVSRLFKGRFRDYSVERLLGFLTAFDSDVDIIVRPRTTENRRGDIRFTSEIPASR